MSVAILDWDTVHKMVQERLNSHQWWLMFNVDLMTDVEDTYYSDTGVGGSVGDFEVLFGGPLGMLSMAFAHKRRMSSQQLAALIEKVNGVTFNASDMKDRDIILVADSDEDLLAAAWLMRNFKGE